VKNFRASVTFTRDQKAKTPQIIGQFKKKNLWLASLPSRNYFQRGVEG